MAWQCAWEFCTSCPEQIRESDDPTICRVSEVWAKIDIGMGSVTDHQEQQILKILERAYGVDSD